MSAETELADLHQGEEPYDDERLLPTPAQWIWRWNRASPERRLDLARYALALDDLNRRIYALKVRWAVRPPTGRRALAELHHAITGDGPDPATTVQQPPAMRMTSTTRQVLATLLDGTGPLWGARICDTTGLLPGTVYPILQRLNARGWTRVTDEPPTGQPGTRRRFHELTDDGRARAQAALGHTTAKES